MRTLCRALLPSLVLVLALVPAAAQPAESDAVRLTVTPAAAPPYALQYALLPPLFDQEPGNAVLLYYLARDAVPSGEDDARVNAWLALPPDQLPRDAVREFLGAMSLRNVELGARRRDADWGLPIEEGVNMLLPRLSEFRGIGKLLALKARLEIVEGRYDDAIRTLQTGFAFARHVGQGPTIIQKLVGIAIAALMQQEVALWIDQPGSPNLYWALARLPDPMVDMAEALEWERSWLFLQFPPLRGLRTANLTPEQWQQAVNELLSMLGDEQEDASALAAVTAVRLYPRAKEYLRAMGMTEEQIEAMPVQQAIAIHSLDVYRRLSDDTYKWFALPYWQAHQGLRQAQQAIEEAARSGEGDPFIRLLPSFGRAYLQTARLDRRLAALRTIEALRMHAAAHDGALPGTLAEIHVVPVPIDPVTGQAFGYELRGRTAVLTGPAPEGNPPSDADRWEVTLE